MLNTFSVQHHSREWEDLTARGFLTAQVERGIALMVEADELIMLPRFDPTQLVCDLCVIDNPATWRYPVKAFEYSPESRIIQGECSLDAWALCDDCAELVNLDMREELLDRAWELIAASLNIPAEHMMEIHNRLSALQAQFLANRCGEPVRISEQKGQTNDLQI